MVFQPYNLVESGIEVDLETKELRFTLGPMGVTDPTTFVTASIKLANLPKAEIKEDLVEVEVDEEVVVEDTDDPKKPKTE